MSYIICFWDKSKLQVDETIGEKLKIAWRNQSIKTFELGANIYAIGGVEKIITKEEAYEAFPLQTEYLSDMSDRIPTKETMLELEKENQDSAGLKKFEAFRSNLPF